MATTYTTELQKLYVAYFNRPADPTGLAFWNTVVTNAGGSTAAVSAEFAKSAEYTAIYKDMSNTQIITQVYQNLFGHAPDPVGRTFWVKALDDKIFTIDQIVAEVANGAQGTDKTAFANKTTAAVAFTTAVDTAAEIEAYSGAEANAVAKTFIAGITTDASLATALTPATLDATVAAVVKAGTAFTLAGGLADLDAANDAIPAFFKSLNALDLDGDGDATTAPDAADIAAEVTAADAAVGVQVTAAGGTYAGSAAVKAAVLADTQAALNTALTAAQKTYTDAVTAAGKVAGLNAAVTAAAAADANLTALTKAELNTKAVQAAAEASYETLNGGLDVTITTATGATETTVGGVDLLVVNASGNLVLATGITEATNPGVTALLNAVKAELVAVKAVDAGTSAKAAADLDVAIHDVGSPAETAALAVLGGEFTITTPKNVAAPTAVEVQTEILGLKGALAAAAPGAPTVAAQAALDAFNAPVTGAVAVYLAANTDPLSAAVTTAATGVTNATKAVTDLDKAVIELSTANGHAATLTGLNDAVTAATAAFADNDFVAPVVATGFHGATTGVDVFLAGATAGTIANFGLQGKDVLYVGNDVTLNTGALSTGVASTLEVFLIQNGANTDVHLETKSFGSATADQVVITLAGVNVADLTYSAGIISHV